MAVAVSYPGVYIEEFTPGAPIQGVGTSTAAFIGAAASGDINEPTKITSWDQFRATFGQQPLPGFFLWYAVRGFFENGAQGVCYVVRASNGAYGALNLADRSGVAGSNVIRVRARQPGNAAIQVAVATRNVIPSASTALYRPTGALTGPVVGRDVILNAGQGANFRPGDWITIAALGERAQVMQVSGDTLRITQPLNNAYAAAAAVRLADIPGGSQALRIASTVALPPGALQPGTMLTVTPAGGTPDSLIVEAAQAENLANPGGGIAETYTVAFRSGTRLPISMAAACTVQSEEFNITVSLGTGSTLYPDLAIDSAHPRYFERVINNDAGSLVRVSLIEPPSNAAPPANLPANLAATALAGGAAEDLATLTDANYRTALDTLRTVDDVNLVAVPDRQTAALQQAMIDHCHLLGDRFAILDSRAGSPLFGTGSVELQRATVDSARGYAALYYPWLRVPPVGSGGPVLVPPSGHICGVISRSDGIRGVHKAPANEIIAGAVGIERNMSDIDQGQLNLQGINIVRSFQGGRPTVWGARTTATDRNWQYVNIRRLFLFLEESIEEGIRWAVFEPNNLALWQKLKRTISEFLSRVWRDGGLFGAKAEDAFYVRIDEVLNPFSEQALGRLNIEIGVRPTYPAEFIIVRIGIWPGGSEVSEG